MLIVWESVASQIPLTRSSGGTYLAEWWRSLKSRSTKDLEGIRRHSTSPIHGLLVASILDLGRERNTLDLLAHLERLEPAALGSSGGLMGGAPKPAPTEQVREASTPQAPLFGELAKRRTPPHVSVG